MSLNIGRVIRQAAPALAALAVTAGPAAAGGVVEQHFPANQPVAQLRTSWRIVWDIRRFSGGSEVFYVKEAWFRRGPHDAPILVLGESRLAEIFVPYNGGARIYDLTAHHFDLVPVKRSDLGPPCVVPGQVFTRDGTESDTGLVAKEVHDDGIRWMNGQEVIRRGQVMSLWAVLNGSNYRYVMLYGFGDDGHIRFRLGATAHNLYGKADDSATHLHTGCWRVMPALGDPAQNDIQLVRFLSDPAHPNPRTVVEDFNGGAEGGAVWKPEEFTRLRVVSRTRTNGHTLPNPIGYELVPVRTGSARYFGVGEQFTQNDFWVTRDHPESPEDKYHDVPSYANGESRRDAAAVLWHQAPVLHVPRDEDFGASNYDNYAGVAITAWAGFDLTPRNFFPSTPLYP
jgi:Cu2+-containing amine oxidase